MFSCTFGLVTLVFLLLLLLLLLLYSLFPCSLVSCSLFLSLVLFLSLGGHFHICGEEEEEEEEGCKLDFRINCMERLGIFVHLNGEVCFWLCCYVLMG